MTLAEDALTFDPDGGFDAYPEAWTCHVDRWLAQTFDRAMEGRSPEGVTLVATGGHGRRALAPGSDLDLVLLHDPSVPESDVGAIAEAIWYPIWAEGMKLGHSVRTTSQALAAAADDLDTATALLSARPIAGDHGAADVLRAKTHDLWRRRSVRMLERLAGSVAERHRSHGEVAFLLEPDLKDGRGGLRDVHALRWAMAAGAGLGPADRADLDAAEAVLTRARIALHLTSGSRGDRLLLEHQDAAAALLGVDADHLAAQVSRSARRVAWIGDATWALQAAGGRPRSPLGWRSRSRAPGVSVSGGVVHLDAAIDPATDPELPLLVADVACRFRRPIGRAALDRLAARTPAPATPWSDPMRRRFVDLLAMGRPAIEAIEALDHVGIWSGYLPEWERVRSRPQRNALHRFTVDRHLLETMAAAAELVEGVDRPDLLLMAALLHDISKGSPGDHSTEGAEVADRVLARMGFEEQDRRIVALLVRHHLLLAETATRRDLTDPAAVEAVARVVDEPRILHLLAALTEADSIATGPTAWSSWKAGLLGDLVRRVEHHLAGGGQGCFAGDGFPSAADLEASEPGDASVTFEGPSGDRSDPGAVSVVTVIAPDGEGLFARVTGALALAGLDVLAARVATVAHGDDGADAMAIQRFEVSGASPPDADRVRHLVTDAVGRRLAVGARLSRLPRPRRAKVAPPSRRPPTVTFAEAASMTCTVVEVDAPDSVGLLHRLALAIAELGLVVVTARAQTRGDRVTDAFYLTDRGGSTIEDPGLRRELVRALEHAAGEPSPTTP